MAFLDGEITEHFDSGELSSKTNYLNGEKHGKSELFRKPLIIYDEDSTILYQEDSDGEFKEKEEHYQNGQLHGKATHYHNNNEVKHEGNYINGEKDGTFTSYFVGGGVFKRLVYDRGILVQ